MTDVDLHQVEWDSYWKSESLKRRIIEYVRRAYFGKIFVDVVCKDIKPGARILEAGCGSGAYLKLLKRKGFRSVGLDLSKASLHIAKKNCKNITGGDIFHLPFKDKAFDVVFNQGVMEHFTNSEFFTALKEIARIARKVVIIVPSALSMFRIYDPFGDDPDKRFLKKSEIEALLQSVLYNVRVSYIIKTGFLSIVGIGNSPDI